MAAGMQDRGGACCGGSRTGGGFLTCSNRRRARRLRGCRPGILQSFRMVMSAHRPTRTHP